jgi:hypothetical protein
MEDFPMRTDHLLAGNALLIAVLAAGVAATGHAATLPVFDPANFVAGARIDNPYLPIGPGTRTVLRAEGIDSDGEAFVETSVLRFGGLGPVIGGVRSTVLRDRAYEDGVLVEDTFDYYAQDTAGNVWYLGEDVTNYYYDADGNLVGTDTASAWITGKNGALPGYAMPAVLTPGFSYFQEYAAADGALDEGLIVDILSQVEAGGVVYDNVLRVFETSMLDPNLREVKYYAPGIGLIRADEGVDAAYGNPQLVFARVAAIPAPASLPLLAGALCTFAWLRRRRR